MSGLKYDKDKARWDLLPKGMVARVVDVLTFGAMKYEENGWQGLENGKERCYGALMRHIDAWRNGEIKDPESGIHHLAHATCNMFFLMWWEDNTVKGYESPIAPQEEWDGSIVIGERPPLPETYCGNINPVYKLPGTIG